ncbi:DUF3500 domain-containing protein [Streptomyces sp. NBC_00708]
MTHVPGPGGPPPGPVTYEAPVTIKRMLFATWALLDSLRPDLKAAALVPDMRAPGRLDWDFIPKPDRAGIPLHALDRHQKVIAQSLLKAGLSMRGYSQALSVMATENMLRELEVVERGFGALAGNFRDPEGYWFSFWGRPGFEDTWGWRVIGHHLSLNYTIVAQRYLAVTPLAMGAQPVGAGVLDALGENERRALSVLHSLSPDAQDRAVIHDVAPADFVTRQVPYVGAEEWPDWVDLGIVGYETTDEDRERLRFVKGDPSGISGADLTGEQLDAVRGLLLYYVETGPGELSRQYREQVLAADPRDLRFAWAGGREANKAHYYRISTRDLLVEADNAVAAGQHAHAVWRDLNNDLGQGLLLDHYAQHGPDGRHLRRRLVSNRPTENSPLETDGWYVPEVYAKH